MEEVCAFPLMRTSRIVTGTEEDREDVRITLVSEMTVSVVGRSGDGKGASALILRFLAYFLAGW